MIGELSFLDQKAVSAMALPFNIHFSKGRVIMKRLYIITTLWGIAFTVIFSFSMPTNTYADTFEWIINGGFESGNMSGWSVTDSGGSSTPNPVPWFANDADPAEGNYSAFADGNFRLTQIFSSPIPASEIVSATAYIRQPDNPNLPFTTNLGLGFIYSDSELSGGGFFGPENWTLVNFVNPEFGPGLDLNKVVIGVYVDGYTSGNPGFDITEVDSISILGSLAPAPPPPALVGYWSFDEGNGSTANDSSGFSNQGEIEDATWVSGKCGNAALSFDGGLDGEIDYVVVSNSDSINTSTFTVSFWVSISDLDETMVFLHKRNGQWWRNFQLSYQANDDRPTGEEKDYLMVKIDGNGTPTPSNDYDNAAYAEVSLESGKYYYVVGTYNQEKLKLYLDGIMIAEHSITISDNVGGGDLYIGTHSADHLIMNPTHGIIDEVRIYNYALSQKQIQADMEACAPLTALSGCINVNGMPLADKKVTLKPQGGPNLTVMTGPDGCYEFGDAIVGKKIKLEVEGP
jgi:hypothetical protein